MRENLILRAAYFAAEKHRNQKRKGSEGDPYINHPLFVAMTLSNCGVFDPDILAAALLHDTVEDTETTFQEIENEFGHRICGIVKEVTDNRSLSKVERKKRQVLHAPLLSEGAAMIKIADKISNIKDITFRPPADWNIERKREYFNWAEAVVNNCICSNEKLLEEFDKTVKEGKRVLGL